jgi:hypothetical protein
MGKRSQKPSSREWNKDKIVGQEGAIKLRTSGAVACLLQMEKRLREWYLFNLGIEVSPWLRHVASRSVSLQAIGGIPRVVDAAQRRAPSGFEITRRSG